jgi:4-hydroxybenzoate polyprenyltransferase
MTKAVHAAWNEVLYGGHLQCLGSVAILGTVAGQFQAPFPWGLPVSAYAVSYAVYIYNRLREMSADAATNPARTAYISAHERVRWLAFHGSWMLAAVVALLSAALPGVIFLATLLAFGLLYTNVFKSLTRFLPGFKTVYVASAFTTLVFLPYAYVGRPMPFAVLAPFAGWVFWNAAIMQIFLDVKDLDSDARAGLRTIPLLLGRPTTFRVLTVLTTLAALPPLLWSRTSHPPAQMAALSIAPLLSLFSLHGARKGDYQAYLLESGKFIFWPALLALGRVLAR